MKPEAAFLLFHLRVGTRLALRVLAPVLAATLFLFYILGHEFAMELARILFVDGSLAESGLIGTFILLGLARAVAPRITAGGAGWARSLPVDRRARRALEVLSLVVAETPLLAVLGALAWAVTVPSPARIAPHFAGLLVGSAAAGLAYLPSPAAAWTRLLPVSACFLSFSGNRAIIGAAAVLLFLGMAFSGKFPVPRTRCRRKRNLPPAAFFHGLSLRAVRGRIVFAYIPPALVLAGGRIFLLNNDLPADKAFSLSLFGLALSLAAFIGTAAGALAARRPAWPWLRSLPRSSAARIRADALFLGLLALPLAAGLALLRRPAWEAAFLAGPLAWLAFRSAGAMRESGDRPFGVLGQIVVEGTIMSLVLALLPWTSGILAAATPGAYLLARNAERRLKPTLWTERHHSNAGDPLSWSES
jgi:hypothetical protein